MQAIRNTIRRYKDQPPLKNPSAGPHVMGLASIKNVIVKSSYGGETTEKDGLQFFFRAAADKQICLCHKVTANIDPKSNLFKLLVRMTRGKYNEGYSESDTFALINTLANKWYEVLVKVRPWKAPDGTMVNFAKVADNDISPARPDECPKAAPLDYWGFKQQRPAEEVVNTIPDNPMDEDEIPF